MLDIF